MSSLVINVRITATFRKTYRAKFFQITKTLTKSFSGSIYKRKKFPSSLSRQNTTGNYHYEGLDKKRLNVFRHPR